jgi:N-acyl-D-aspartate/D-glutamate deacylase
MAYDLVIRNGTIVDGSGLDAYRADVGIVGNRIAAVGRIRERGAQDIDADGHVVTPGFIDGHTHMDAQIFWDPLGTFSCHHGVTTVVMGHCGFTLAPASEAQRHLVVRNLERAEDISGEAMAAGIEWAWTTFAEYLDVAARSRDSQAPRLGGEQRRLRRALRRRSPPPRLRPHACARRARAPQPDGQRVGRGTWRRPGRAHDRPLARARLQPVLRAADVSQMSDCSIQTHMLAHWVRGREDFTLEEAVRMMTLAPARAWGFHDRGLVREGLVADLNVFDPATVAPDLPAVVHDLPAGEPRLKQTATGFRATVVGGAVTLHDGVHTGATPGVLVRGPGATRR